MEKVIENKPRYSTDPEIDPVIPEELTGSLYVTKEINRRYWNEIGKSIFNVEQLHVDAEKQCLALLEEGASVIHHTCGIGTYNELPIQYFNTQIMCGSALGSTGNQSLSGTPCISILYECRKRVFRPQTLEEFIEHLPSFVIHRLPKGSHVG